MCAGSNATGRADGPRRVLFYSSISYANDRPSGAAKSNLYQMEALSAQGHECVLVCRLTAARENRDAAIDTAAPAGRRGRRRWIRRS